MSINSNFLNLTLNTQYETNAAAETAQAQQVAQNTDADTLNNSLLQSASGDTIGLNGQTTDVWCNPTDEQVIEFNLISKTQKDVSAGGQHAIIQNLAQENFVEDIKMKLYKYHHPSLAGLGTGYGGTTEGLAQKLGFTGAANSTISKSVLVSKILENETDEDNSGDIMACLNLAFKNKPDDYQISYKEVQDFLIGVSDKVGGDVQNKVNAQALKDAATAYAEEIQTQFEAKSEQEKVQFILQEARTYLRAAGLFNNSEGLGQLAKTNDTTTDPDGTVELGQIKFLSNLAEDKEGAYVNHSTLSCNDSPRNAGAGEYELYLNNALGPTGTYKFSTAYYSASDNDQYDFGIRLNKNILNGKWYDAVARLVELSNAVSSVNYYNGQIVYEWNEADAFPSKWINGFSMELFNIAEEIGLIENAQAMCSIQYQITSNPTVNGTRVVMHDNTNTFLDSNNQPTELYKKLLYLAEFLRGRFIGAKNMHNYLDTIGNDTLNFSTLSDSAKKGEENTQIINAISQKYNYKNGTANITELAPMSTNWLDCHA